MKNLSTKRTCDEWQITIAAAEKHPARVKAYCLEHGIKVSCFYVMQSKLRRKENTQREAFVSAKIVEAQLFPDAEWVATFCVTSLEL